MAPFTIYVHTGSEGLPFWAVIPLTALGCYLAIQLLRGIVFVFSLRSELRVRRRIAQVRAAGGADGPYSASVVEDAAKRLFAEVHAAWDAGDRDRLRQLSDPDLMSDWAKRMDGYTAAGKRLRIKPVRRPRVRYVSLLADRGLVRVWIRSRVRRRFEKLSSPRREPRFGFSYWFEEYWTLSRRDDEWILWSTRPDKLREEYTTEPIVAPGAVSLTPG